MLATTARTRRSEAFGCGCCGGHGERDKRLGTTQPCCRGARCLFLRLGIRDRHATATRMHAGPQHCRALVSRPHARRVLRGHYTAPRPSATLEDARHYVIPACCGRLPAVGAAPAGQRARGAAPRQRRGSGSARHSPRRASYGRGRARAGAGAGAALALPSVGRCAAASLPIPRPSEPDELRRPPPPPPGQRKASAG